MPAWLPALLYLLSTLALMVLRTPHIRRSLAVPVAESRVSARERLLITGVLLGMMLMPLAWLATDALADADRPAPAWSLVAGALCALAGLWLLQRSHRDLGANWSTTLEIRVGHRLVSAGVYRRVRHPMYSAFLLHALGQLLIVPNWIAGPAYLVAFVLLIALRLGPEERMLRDVFGPAFVEYRARSWRLVPGLY